MTHSHDALSGSMSHQNPITRAKREGGQEHIVDSFLSKLEIKHGPIGLLGRYFLLAERLLRDRGLSIEITGIEQASSTHVENKMSWNAFPPMLDARLSHIDPDKSYCFLGRDSDGQVMFAQAGRIFELGERSFADIISDQSFFYGPAPVVSENAPTCETWSTKAREITGTIVYSGALWVHPDARGGRLASVLTRLSRSYALAKWGTRFTVAFVSEDMAKTPLVGIYGYKNLDDGAAIYGLFDEPIMFKLMWMSDDELIADLASFYAERSAQIDSANVGRSAKDVGLSALPDRDQRA
ncbi:MAG: hypothetical protein ACR2OV_04780 [Hyphomicrobiaceae bacterium]